MFLFVLITSCASGESVCECVLRVRMSLQSLEGLVFYETVLRRCFQVVCCLVCVGYHRAFLCLVLVCD